MSRCRRGRACNAGISQMRAVSQHKPHQQTSTNINQHLPTSTGVFAGKQPSRPSKPWPGFPQRRYVSKRSRGSTKLCPRRAGRSPGWPASRTAAAGLSGQGGASHRSPSRATTRRPGGRAGRRTRRFHRGLPPGRRVVGLRQVDGMPHDSQRARSSVVSP